MTDMSHRFHVGNYSKKCLDMTGRRIGVMAIAARRGEKCLDI